MIFIAPKTAYTGNEYKMLEFVYLCTQRTMSVSVIVVVVILTDLKLHAHYPTITYKTAFTASLIK